MKLPWKPKKPAEYHPWDWVRWCQAVLREVRFYPDHKAIETELLAHLTDSRDRLERRGYARKEAEQKALEAMGSSQEVGRALNSAHRPFWGWLWQLTRGMIVLLLAFSALLVWQNSQEHGGFLSSIPASRTLAQLQAGPVPENALRTTVGEYTVWYDPHLTVTPAQEPYTVWAWPDIEIDRAAAGEWYVAELRFWVEQKPWTGEPRWVPLLEPEDETGPLRETSLHQYVDRAGYWGSWGGWTRNAFTYTIALLHEPTYLELRYPYGNNESLVLRAEQEGAA